MNRDVIIAAAVSARAEKAAGFSLTGVGKGLGSFAMKAVTKPGAGGVGRAFSPGRTAMLGAGAVGAESFLQPDQNNSINPFRRSAGLTAGRTANPATWLNPNSAQGAFNNARDHFSGLNSDINKQIDQAYAANDHDLATRLTNMQKNQTFAGGDNWTTQQFHRFNPFGAGTMATYSGAAHRQAGTMQNQLDAIRTRMEQRRGQPGFDPASLGGKIKGLEGSLGEDLKSIPQVGEDMKQTNAAGGVGATAAGDWGQFGRANGDRPGAGPVRGWAVNPYDGRKEPQYDPSAAIWGGVSR